MLKRQARALTPTEEMWVLWGIAAQPFVAGALAFIAFPVLLLDRSGRTLAGAVATDVTHAALSVAIGAGMVAVVVALVGALPTATWLMKRRDVSLGVALLFGVAFGNVPFAVGASLAGAYGLPGLLRGLAFSSVLGVGGAAAFWAIALRRESVSHSREAG
jgi:hypothetical protein